MKERQRRARKIAKIIPPITDLNKIDNSINLPNIGHKKIKSNANSCKINKIFEGNGKNLEWLKNSKDNEKYIKKNFGKIEICKNSENDI